MQLIKKFVYRFAPSLGFFLKSFSSRRYYAKRYEAFQDKMEQKIYPQKKPFILSGPFKGMLYFNKIIPGPITPKWLGSYEYALHPIIEHLVKNGYMRIINVGCAEGYYACGMALRSPEAEVYAFDCDFFARRSCKALARMNKCELRVHVSSYCSHKTLTGLIDQSTLIICDIEGGEKQLLDPLKVPKLLECDILVEVHEVNQAAFDMEKLLNLRFEHTHTITRIKEFAPKPQPYVALCDGRLDEHTIATCLAEGRLFPQVWLWMELKR